MLFVPLIAVVSVILLMEWGRIWIVARMKFKVFEVDVCDHVLVDSKRSWSSLLETEAVLVLLQ